MENTELPITNEYLPANAQDIDNLWPEGNLTEDDILEMREQALMRDKYINGKFKRLNPKPPELGGSLGSRAALSPPSTSDTRDKTAPGV